MEQMQQMRGSSAGVVPWMSWLMMVTAILFWPLLLVLMALAIVWLVKQIKE